MMDLGSIANWWGTPLLHIVLVGVAGIVVWHLIPGRFANARLIVQIAFFLVMSALLLGGPIIPYEALSGTETPAGAVLVTSAKLLWWVHLAWALIGFVRIYLVVEGKPREARLLQDLVVGVVYVGIFLSILAFVFAMPVGTLIATSGVFAIVLGLALQNTLSDVFSGIALNLGRPYTLGDWIVLGDGTEGRVIETDWRATHLLTSARNVVVLPNRFLAQLGLTNVSSPNESHRLSVKVRIAPTATPAVIVGLMDTVLKSSNLIVKDPPSYVGIRSMDATALEVDLFFGVADVDHRVAAKNEIFDLVHRHSKANGLLLAIPPSASVFMKNLPDQRSKALALSPLELIRAIPIFSALTDQEQETLAAAVSVRTYCEGEIIVEQGEMLRALMIVCKGVIVRERGDGGRSQEMAHLAPGDFFGGVGLLAGSSEMSTLRATTAAVIYEIDHKSMAPLLLRHPEMAENLAAILSADMPAIGGSGAPTQQHAHSKFTLLKSIQRVFEPRGRTPAKVDHKTETHESAPQQRE